MMGEDLLQDLLQRLCPPLSNLSWAQLDEPLWDRLRSQIRRPLEEALWVGLKGTLADQLEEDWTDGE